MRKNIGSVLALYPTPVTVVGALVEGKPNWLLVAHVGILGHDGLLISLAKAHYTNAGILETKKVSVNLVDEALLPKADQVGCVSGHQEDKSKMFEIEMSPEGIPMIEASPLSMACMVQDVYETQGFDNFILKIEGTYVKEGKLDENGKPDYEKIQPVLFEMPSYKYLRCGNVIGNCMKIGKEKV